VRRGDGEMRAKKQGRAGAVFHVKSRRIGASRRLRKKSGKGKRKEGKKGTENQTGDVTWAV
jgi:hypothetical protein